MSQKIKYLSRIRDEFDTVICGVNGVFMQGENIDENAVETLIKLYQSGKKVALASNTGMRAHDLYYLLKRCNVPMNIFYAIVTAGEIAHFYLKNNRNLGHKYSSLSGTEAQAVVGLDYQASDSIVLADFVLAETSEQKPDLDRIFPLLEQALHLHLPLLCIGNDTSQMSDDGVILNVGAIAEKYALMGGQIIPFGKPDVRIAAYLTEGLPGFLAHRCLVIGDCMATDMRMGNNFGAKTLLVGSGVHQISENAERRLDDLSVDYGLNVDYFTETLLW